MYRFIFQRKPNRILSLHGLLSVKYHRNFRRLDNNQGNLDSIIQWHQYGNNNNFSPPEHQIAGILRSKNIMFYPHLRLPFCKNIDPLEYDFICFLISNKYIVPFAIEYDGIHHFNQNLKSFRRCHVSDILKQYYLFSMNIHLLRLNTLNGLEDSIINFTNQISNSSYYLSTNMIKPIPKYFPNKPHPGLAYYYQIGNQYLK